MLQINLVKCYHLIKMRQDKREDATELAKEQRDMAGGDGVPQIEDDPEAQEKEAN